MFLSEWREFLSAPCLAGKKKLYDSSRLLTCFRACFLPGRAKDLSVYAGIVKIGSVNAFLRSVRPGAH